MITQKYLEQNGDQFLFRLAVDDSSVLDVLTTPAILQECCLRLGKLGPKPPETINMGTFGPFEVTLTVGPDETATILIEGPTLGEPFRGNQASGVYVSRTELLSAIQTVTNAA